jgi:HD superfamily phosphodiesterase
MPRPNGIGELFKAVPELHLIASVSVKDLVIDTFLNIVDERFWGAPSSFSGKFHLVPDGSGRVDTQLDGCRRTARVAHHLATLYGLNPVKTDIVVAASLLHDICAGEPDWDKTNPNHAKLAADLIRSTNEYPSSPWDIGSDWQSIIKDIAYCVENHMAWWGSENWDALIWRNSTSLAKAAQIVAIGDYLSAQKDIWVQLPEDRFGIKATVCRADNAEVREVALLKESQTIVNETRIIVDEIRTIYNKLEEWAKKWDGSIEVHELSPLLKRLDKTLKKWKHE